MKQVVTKGIVLSRTDFGEADRILTVLTPDHGKVRVMARGVRKVKSKMAGGIELFSISQINFIPGRGDIATLTSTRLIKHYSKIVQDLNRTLHGYELLKKLHKATEDAAGPEYFDLLAATLAGLNDAELDLGLLEAWFEAQLLKLSGHSPNLKTSVNGDKLEADQTYVFDPERMAFSVNQQGKYSANHIKLMRLLFGLKDPLALKQITDGKETFRACQPLIRAMHTQFM